MCHRHFGHTTGIDCTGWRAQHAMSARFPDAFIPNSAGTSFHL